MSEVHRIAVEIGGTEIAFETGKMAKQASGAVTVTAGDTVVLSTATAGNLRDVDFLPLTVDVEERMYAAGKIPGSFFKREGRAGEKATLIARMIDRPLRPLFPKGWRRETQLVNLTLSVDQVHTYDILAMNGASAALMISDIPYPTAVGAVRIGKVDGNFVVNPTEEQLLTADMDLVVAGTDEAVLMVECGANEVPEAEILDALDIAHSAIKQLCAAQVELQKKAGKPKVEVEVPKANEQLIGEIANSHGKALDEATSVQDKLDRQNATKAVEEAVLEKYSGPSTPTPTPSTARTRSSRSTRSRRRSSASASPSTRSARTAARSARSGRSRSTSSRCRARTAPRCSRAVRRRPCRSSRSARRARRCAWTTSVSRRPSATSTTTTSRPSRWARPASCAAPSAVTSAMARSPSARWSR